MMDHYCFYLSEEEPSQKVAGKPTEGKESTKNDGSHYRKTSGTTSTKKQKKGKATGTAPDKAQGPSPAPQMYKYTLEDFSQDDILASGDEVPRRCVGEDQKGNDIYVTLTEARFNVTVQSEWTLDMALRALNLEFFKRGFPLYSREDGTVGCEAHPLLSLYLGVRHILHREDEISNNSQKTNSETTFVRAMRSMLQRAVELTLDTIDGSEPAIQDLLPQHADVLALRYLTPSGGIPSQIAGSLASLEQVHLMVIPKVKNDVHTDPAKNEKRHDDLVKRLEKTEKRLKKLEDGATSHDKGPHTAQKTPDTTIEAWSFDAKKRPRDSSRSGTPSKKPRIGRTREPSGSPQLEDD